MPTINTLREQRAAKIDRAKAISAKAETENRDLDAGERAEFEAVKTDVEALEGRIKRASDVAEWEKRADSSAPTFHDGELRGYSVAKALSEGMNGSLSGVEREAHDELAKGRETRGVMIPTEFLMEQRALTTTAPAGSVGGNLVATDLAAMTDRRRSRLLVEGMGATVLRGLVGNVDLPRLVSSGSAHWVAEHANTMGSNAGFKKKSMGPKTVSAQYEVSRRMLLQSNVALEPLLRADLGYLLAQAVDSAAIKGGGAEEPIGILEDTDVEFLAAAALDSDLTSELLSALEVDDVSGTTAFLTHPIVMAMARKIKDTTGRVISTAETFHNVRAEASNNVPYSTPAVVGPPAVAAKFPLIYGEWASLYVGYWSGVDILVNPYHADVAGKGGALLHAFLDCDVLVRHPEGFRWVEIL